MKRIFTLLASLIMSVSLFAAPVNTAAGPKSILSVKATGGEDVRIVMDGRRFDSPTSSIRIQNVEPGLHTIRVLRQKSSGLFNIMITRYEVVYNSSLKVKPGTMITITIDPFGRANVDESRIGRESFDRDTYWDRDHGYDNDHDGKWGDYDSNEGYERAMEDRQFNQVLESISKEWLESNKLKSATQIVRSNYVTSAQVKQLVCLFGFESNKLELAKQAYANTVDKKNYFMVSDEFSFSSSKDELARYIRNSR